MIDDGELAQGRNKDKLPWVDIYLIEEGEASNCMSLLKESSTKESPKRKKMDRAYCSKMMHRIEESCELCVEGKEANAKPRTQGMYPSPPSPNDPWRHDDSFIIAGLFLKLYDFIPYHINIDASQIASLLKLPVSKKKLLRYLIILCLICMGFKLWMPRYFVCRRVHGFT